MKGKLLAFASILCVASLMASGANADKPEDRGKPGKTNTELIFFTGDLQGWAHVEGCCPNAGPSPEYTITLKKPLLDAAGDAVYPIGTYNGELFINIDGVGHNSENNNIVQFHACCDDHVPCIDLNLPPMSFAIIGGEGVEVGRKKDRVSTVTFFEESWFIQRHRDDPMGPVTFELTSAPSHMEDDFLCAELIPAHLCPLP